MPEHAGQVMTGYELSKTLDCLKLLSRDYPDVVSEARINVIYQKGAAGECGALGFSPRQCQMLIMDPTKRGYFEPIKKLVYRQARELWLRFSLAELESMHLAEGMSKGNPEAAWDSYRLA